MAAATENTPLLGNGAHKPAAVVRAEPKKKKHHSLFSPANRILLAGFLMAFTLGITQVPYVK